MGSLSEESLRREMARTYSEQTIDHALRPRNRGVIKDPGGFGRVGGGCGDTIEIWLKVENEVISEVAFLSDGCAATQAAGSMITELAKGKTTTEALGITEQDVLDGLGGLPPDNRHCAQLAVNTLRAAITDYLALAREPWKKAYRKY